MIQIFIVLFWCLITIDGQILIMVVIIISVLLLNIFVETFFLESSKAFIWNTNYLLNYKCLHVCHIWSV